MNTNTPIVLRKLVERYCTKVHGAPCAQQAEACVADYLRRWAAAGQYCAAQVAHDTALHNAAVLYMERLHSWHASGMMNGTPRSGAVGAFASTLQALQVGVDFAVRP